MDCIDFLVVIILSFLCMPSVLCRILKSGSKIQNAMIHAFIFSVLLCLYFTLMGDSNTEGFTKNGLPDNHYKNSYDKCIRTNAPPFMGSISDTVNYCLNRISSRFVKMN